ncbi:MAG: hypothetical protein ONB05_05990 [candidate division KSB1 bacterium]|nr:hypothetical protein [candidate division KSB1 bacterium]
MRRLIIIPLFLAFVWQSAFSQILPRERVQLALERLDEQLTFAREMVLFFDGELAKDLLRRAEELREAAEINLNNGRLLLAMRRIKRAQEVIDQALKVSLEESAQKMRELLKRAQDIVPGSHHEEAERLLREAKDHQDKAIMAFRNQRTQEALEHYRQAVFLAEKSMELVQGKSRDNEKGFNEEKQRFRELLERAKEMVQASQNEEAKKVLRQAMKQAQETKEALDQGNFQLAIEGYHKATRLLLRAIDLAGGDVRNIEASAWNEVTVLEELIRSTQEKIEGSKNERALFLLERALILQQEAQQALAAKEYQVALRQAGLARNFMGRALRVLDTRVPELKPRTEQELNQLQQDLKEIATKVKATPDKEAHQLIDLAQKNADLAEQACKNEKYQLARERIWVANRFLFTADVLALGSQQTEVVKDKIEARIQNFDDLLAGVKTQIENSHQELALELLQQAQAMRQEAEKALKDEHLNIAKECLDVALELIRKSMGLIRN